jgi:hypothetical protein
VERANVLNLAMAILFMIRQVQKSKDNQKATDDETQLALTVLFVASFKKRIDKFETFERFRYSKVFLNTAFDAKSEINADIPELIEAFCKTAPLDEDQGHGEDSFIDQGHGKLPVIGLSLMYGKTVPDSVLVYGTCLMAIVGFLDLL